MKNKKLWIAIAFVVVCASAFTGIFLASRKEKATEVKDFATLEEAVGYAGFPLEHSDRLAGEQVSGYQADEKTITVLYTPEGSISKTLLDEGEVPETAESDSAELQETEVLIRGVPVTFYGSEGTYSSARWIDNGFSYVITLSYASVTADEMTIYVESTR